MVPCGFFAVSALCAPAFDGAIKEAKTKLTEFSNAIKPGGAIGTLGAGIMAWQNKLDSYKENINNPRGRNIEKLSKNLENDLRQYESFLQKNSLTSPLLSGPFARFRSAVMNAISVAVRG